MNRIVLMYEKKVKRLLVQTCAHISNSHGVTSNQRWKIKPIYYGTSCKHSCKCILKKLNVWFPPPRMTYSLQAMIMSLYPETNRVSGENAHQAN